MWEKSDGKYILNCFAPTQECVNNGKWDCSTLQGD